jgi:hydrogenase/urease accessory protein HupE
MNKTYIRYDNNKNDDQTKKLIRYVAQVFEHQKKLIHWSHMHEVSQIIGSTHPLIGSKHMVVHIRNRVVSSST